MVATRSAGWTALGRALPVLPALRWFSACDCAGMGDAGIAALVAELPRCALLRDLWLERCGIGATGAVALLLCYRRALSFATWRSQETASGQRARPRCGGQRGLS